MDAKPGQAHEARELRCIDCGALLAKVTPGQIELRRCKLTVVLARPAQGKVYCYRCGAPCSLHRLAALDR